MIGRFYWVIDFRPSRDGKTMHPVVIGGRCFNEEGKAQRYLDGLADASPKAEILELSTSNSSKASQQIKAILMARTHSIDQGMTKAVHTLPNTHKEIKEEAQDRRADLHSRIRHLPRQTHTHSSSSLEREFNA